jgi:peroxiredoxin
MRIPITAEALFLKIAFTKDDTMQKLLDDQVSSAEQEWLGKWRDGPTRSRWTTLPLQVGDRAPNFELQAAGGGQFHLSDFWAMGPAVLMFWRHYGCSCGMDRAVRLQSEYANYLQLGANVVVIGQGEPERSMLYAKQQNLPCLVLCDPTSSVFEAYDLLEGQPGQIVYDAPDEFLRMDFEAGKNLQKQRHGTQRATVDSPWQLPGEFVVDRLGRIQLAYRYQYCENWPDSLVLEAAIKEAIRKCDEPSSTSSGAPNPAEAPEYSR